MDDGTLVLACRQGDQAAFGAIYDRYADKLHDFCHSVLRDRHEAADAMQETFLIAAQRMGQLREPERLRAWLYAIARHESLRRARARNRGGPAADDGGVPEMASTDAGPDESAHQAELAAMVDAAADGLAPRDRAILDLHLRQGLDGQELADAMGVSASHSYVLVSRVKDQVGRSLGALLLARFGRGDCADLSTVLGHDWDGKLNPLLRKRVARHADGCETCGERRRTSLNPVALLSAMPLVPAAPGARKAVLDKFSLISHSEAISLPGWQADGFPPLLDRPRRRRSPWVYSASVAAVLIVVALLWKPAGPTTELDIAANPSLPADTTTTTTAGAVDDIVEPAGDDAAAVVITPGRSRPSSTLAEGVPVVVPPVPGVDLDPHPDPGTVPGGPTTTPEPSTPDVARPPAPAPPAPAPLSVTAGVIPAKLMARGCTGSTGTVSATVTGPSPVTEVVLHWTNPSGSSSFTVMTATGGSAYSATLGPFAAASGPASAAQWWVVATDSTGAKASTPQSSVPVSACGSGSPVAPG